MKLTLYLKKKIYFMKFAIFGRIFAVNVL